MKPLEDFQQSIKEMQGKCKEISGAIDAQVKAVEAAEKEEKASTLRLIYRDNIGELETLIPFERLLDNRWLNKTLAIAEAKKSLCQSIENIRSDLDFIRENCGEDVEPCTTEYLRNLSVNEAVREHTRREKSRAAQRDAEAAREAAERARFGALGWSAAQGRFCRGVWPGSEKPRIQRQDLLESRCRWRCRWRPCQCKLGSDGNRHDAADRTGGSQ